MKKILLASLVSAVALSTTVHAGSDLQISANSDFSGPKTDFSPGETIYVKVTAGSEGKTKKELNLRDNAYDLISSQSLNYLGNNTFQGSITAPANSGYYSLETRIESDGSVSNSVKTIKIGSSSSGVNVKVKIENGTGKVLGSSPAPASQNRQSINPTPSETPSAAPASSPSPETSAESQSDQKQNTQNMFEKIFGYFKQFFQSIF